MSDKPPKTIPPDMLPSDEGGLAQKTQRTEPKDTLPPLPNPPEPSWAIKGNGVTSTQYLVNLAIATFAGVLLGLILGLLIS